MAAPGNPKVNCDSPIVAARRVGQQTGDSLVRAPREREGRRAEDGQGLRGLGIYAQLLGLGNLGVGTSSIQQPTRATWDRAFVDGPLRVCRTP